MGWGGGGGGGGASLIIVSLPLHDNLLDRDIDIFQSNQCIVGVVCDDYGH